MSSMTMNQIQSAFEATIRKNVGAIIEVTMTGLPREDGKMTFTVSGMPADVEKATRWMDDHGVATTTDIIPPDEDIPEAFAYMVSAK